MNMRHFGPAQVARSIPGARLRLVDETPAMVWTARPDLSCEYLSREWLAFTGCAPEQALGEGWSRGVHPEDLARWLDTCVRAFDAREPFQIEYRLRRHDGEYRWVLDRAVPRFGADGGFIGYVGTCIDIEERKRAESGMARSLERERKLRLATQETSRAKNGLMASVLEELQSPVNAIVAWTAHLRQQVADGTEAARALDSIEHNARAQRRIISSLLELSRVGNGEAPSAAQPPRAALLAGIRVLVVDADPGARESILKVLQIAGAEASSASTAGEALDLLSSWRPDVLLADVALRAELGYDLIRSVRALPAELGGCLRAVALTGAQPDAGPRAIASGYDAQLAKPVEPVALLATVARLAHAAGV